MTAAGRDVKTLVTKLPSDLAAGALEVMDQPADGSVQGALTHAE
jgi:hypothetical protein